MASLLYAPFHLTAEMPRVEPAHWQDVVPTAELPLVDAGVTSLKAVLIARQLAERIGVPLSPTLVYSHPTARDIVNALVEQLAERAQEPERAPSQPADAQSSRILSLGGISGHLPGSVHSMQRLHALASGAADAVHQIPASRWLMEDGIPGAHPLWAMKEIRFNAFIPTGTATAFDATKFGISFAEARAMDPQQRLLLEVGYEAMHGAGRRMAALARRCISVAVGMQNVDHEYMAILGRLPASTYGATGTCQLPQLTSFQPPHETRPAPPSS